jgi:perosamine synthetase
MSTNPPDHLPVCEPFFWGNEKAYVLEALDGRWISSAGVYITRFEAGFAAYCGPKHGIAVANGTVALHLALLAAGIGEGDEVIISDFTMFSPALAVVQVGAKLVPIDAEPDTWTIDCNAIEAKITPRTKAILAVHIYGHPCDMDAINAIAQRHGIMVIEDAAEAHGALVRGRRAGSMSHLSCFSFYANKIITTGEGGMVLTDDDHMAQHLREHRNLCFGKGTQRFIHHDLGFNYRLTNLQAAIGLAQLEHIDKAISRKQEIARAYDNGLTGIPGLMRHCIKPWATNVYWVYGIILADEFGMSRDDLMAKLLASGIETRAFFTGLHQQPVLAPHLASHVATTPDGFINSAYLGARGLYLPSFMHMTAADITRVCQAVREAQVMGK